VPGYRRFFPRCAGNFLRGNFTGCDIYLYAEKKVDGEWQFQGKAVKDEDGWMNVIGPSFYDDRNYNLFAILADVRNGRGFAGVKTGEGFVPIDQPRGTPEDASETYRQLVKSWDSDGHSHSYFTLRELLDYDWTQTTQLQGLVSLVEWRRWNQFYRKEGYGPDNYCSMVSGQGVKHISSEEADALFAGLSAQRAEEVVAENPHTYAWAKWSVPYYRAAGSFTGETIPRLLKLANGTQHLDDVRIVFFFDD